MSVSLLRITYFQADKIHNVGARRVGQSAQSAPYRITTYKGPEMGLMGVLPAVLYKLHEVNSAQSANDELHEEIPASLLQKLKRRCMGH
jgi:hypothetical protein